MHVCPLLVAGLVHAHRGETIEHGRHRGFQAGGDPARDMAGRPARDAWESAHGLLVGGRHRPRIPHPEIPGEPAARLRPRHSGDHHAMLRARLARRQAHELDPMAAEVLVAPPPAPHPDHRRESGTQRGIVRRHVLNDHAFDVRQSFEWALRPRRFLRLCFLVEKQTCRKRPSHIGIQRLTDEPPPTRTTEEPFITALINGDSPTETPYNSLN